MPKEIAKKTTEEEAIKQWRKQNTTTAGKFNNIKLDNTRFDPETDVKNENFGKIFAFSYADGEEHIEEIKCGTSFFPAHSRVQVSCRDYEKDPKSNKQKAKYWCREVDRGDDIELMDPDGDVVFTGQYKDCKDKFNLKYQAAIYVWYKSKMYRWRIGGGSLSSWFDVNNKMTDLGWPCCVIIKTITPQKNNTIHWNDIEFELGEKFDVMKAVNLRNNVDDMLKEYYAKQKEKLVRDTQVEEAKKVFIDDGKTTENGEDDLPF